MKRCDKCPWFSGEERDKKAITTQLKLAAISGQFFCCHVRMGRCYGAVELAKTQPKTKTPRSQSGRGVALSRRKSKEKP